MIVENSVEAEAVLVTVLVVVFGISIVSVIIKEVVVARRVFVDVISTVDGEGDNVVVLLIVVVKVATGSVEVMV